jgi:hypothetical protein
MPPFEAEQYAAGWRLPVPSPLVCLPSLGLSDSSLLASILVALEALSLDFGGVLYLHLRTCLGEHVRKLNHAGRATGGHHRTA